MPTFRKSPPGLLARFDELASGAGGADRKQTFGYPTCVLNGNMFMGLHEDSLILRLAEADRAEFLSRYGGPARAHARPADDGVCRRPARSGQR